MHYFRISYYQDSQIRLQRFTLDLIDLGYGALGILPQETVFTEFGNPGHMETLHPGLYPGPQSMDQQPGDVPTDMPRIGGS